jgi:hypothetical protein
MKKVIWMMNSEDHEILIKTHWLRMVKRCM